MGPTVVIVLIVPCVTHLYSSISIEPRTLKRLLLLHFNQSLSMPVITLNTFVRAAPQIVFNLSRSIDLHQTSMSHTNEKAIAGTTTGLINEGETVTWVAKHFFKTRRLKVRITQMQPYAFFEDEMLQGDFKSMKHKHIFTPTENGTLMTDEFSFEAPYGFIGKFFNYIILTAYMKALLMQRNRVIKEYAENGKWKTVLLQTHR